MVYEMVVVMVDEVVVVVVVSGNTVETNSLVFYFANVNKPFHFMSAATLSSIQDQDQADVIVSCC